MISLLLYCSSECEVCEKLFSLKAEIRNEVEEMEKVCCCWEKDKKCPASSALNWWIENIQIARNR